MKVSGILSPALSCFNIDTLFLGENMGASEKVVGPEWAVTMILQLREVEVHLGHIPKALSHNSEFLKDVAEKAHPKVHGPISEALSESLFKKIVLGLRKEGCDDEKISSLMNQYISYESGPKYCSPEEVSEIK